MEIGKIDYVLCKLAENKEDGFVNCTWNDIANAINERYGTTYTESGIRKRYAELKRTNDEITSTKEEEENDIVKEICDKYKKLNLQRLRIHDERVENNKNLRAYARIEDIKDILTKEIRSCGHIPVEDKINHYKDSKKKMVIMISDIHYGLTFSNAIGMFSTKIALERMQKYSYAIQRYAHRNGIKECYICLMGDLISGSNHKLITVENREDVVKQIVGCSEVLTNFLTILAYTFDSMNIINVSGNHSRITEKADDALRAERLDALIPWYLKERMRDMEEIHFIENNIDETFAEFDVCGHTFVAVHGDFDNSPREAKTRLETLIGKPIDYFLTAHMHTPMMLFDEVNVIRNGCVSGSGDEYTVKKRLFGKPYQVFMIVGEEGVESINPVKLLLSKDGKNEDGSFE